MILDNQLLFSDSQAITSSALSSNVIDSLGTSVVPGTPVTPITAFAQVVVPFVGGTSLQVSVVSADDAALSINATTHFTTAAIPLASLAAGAKVLATSLPPQKLRKYVGLRYTVGGTMTAGAITAGIIDTVDSQILSTGYAKNFAVS